MFLEEMYFNYASKTTAPRAKGAPKTAPVQMCHTHTAYNDRYDEANRYFLNYDLM